MKKTFSIFLALFASVILWANEKASLRLVTNMNEQTAEQAWVNLADIQGASTDFDITGIHDYHFTKMRVLFDASTSAANCYIVIKSVQNSSYKCEFSMNNTYYFLNEQSYSGSFRNKGTLVSGETYLYEFDMNEVLGTTNNTFYVVSWQVNFPPSKVWISTGNIPTPEYTYWVETCGASVSKVNGYWPYISQYNSFDHQNECTYTGSNATVRYLDRYSNNGAHVYLAANRDCNFTISGIPGGKNPTVIFDVVCYQSGASNDDYANTDAFSFFVNGIEANFNSMQLSSTEFKKLGIDIIGEPDNLTLTFTKPSTEATEVRLDNFIVAYPNEDDTTQYYTLTVNAGNGGSVNTTANGTYRENSHIVITATPSEGYEFKEWSDHNTENPRTIIMTEDITLTAYFIQTPTCAFPELEGKKGNAILESLHDMIASHTILTYDQVRADRAQVDFRSDGTLWDMYSNCTFYSSDYCNNSNATTTTECDCYNREHSLPKSWWGSSTDEPMYTDLHHVISTDAASNSHRGADAYGEVSGTPDWSNSLGSKQGNTTTYTGGGYRKVFEPADMYKGDFARIYFYMITCYNDKNFAQGGQGYRMFTYSGSKADFTPAALNLLLKWHRADPVSEKELLRNNAVEEKQGNRNPFVDDPELVEYIWGTKKNTAYSCSGEGNGEDIDVITMDDNLSAQKILRDGQLFIIRGEKIYTITGAKVK